ncbi:MAG: fasciclin domain-containing protein [Candidatus Dormiibacterota bacterium]
MRRIFVGLFAGLIAAALGSGAVPVAASGSSQTIVGIAVSNPDFSTLVAAVSCTGLVPALNGTAKYTVFAPTNEAFAKLGLNASNVCSALPRATLKNILLYHVTAGTRLAKRVLPREAGETRELRTLLEDQSFEVNRAGVITTSSGSTSKIVATNIRASNGVIHVIDSVLIPGANSDREGDQENDN